MTLSKLEPSALRRLTSQQIADLALQADQQARKLTKLGQLAEAAAWDAESERLCRFLNQGRAA